MTTITTTGSFTRATRKGHGFYNGQLIEWAGVDAKRVGDRIIRGRIYVHGTAMMIVPVGSDWNPSADDFTYAEYRDAIIAAKVIGIGGVATRFWARPVDEVEVEEPASFHECGSCSEPMPVEDGDLCESCEEDAHLVAAEAAVVAGAPVLHAEEHGPDVELELVIVPCSADKRSKRLPARELYKSDHFAYTLEHAEDYADRVGAKVVIMSAHYGLIEPDAWIAPYDVKVDDVTELGREQLRVEVTSQLVGFGATKLTTLLPNGYLAQLALSAGDLGLPIVNVYLGCRGIGEQRAAAARIAEHVAGIEKLGVAVPPRYVPPATLDHEAHKAKLAEAAAAAADNSRRLAEEAEAARLVTIGRVRAAAEAGVSEYQLAELAGVQRSTVRSWLGK
jgi:hypothetical protein